jgi:cyanophycinase
MSSPARFLLMGSGEFEPWSSEVERAALGERTGPILVLPTACAPEGEKVWQRWSELALDHYRDDGVEAEVLPLRTREDAGRDDIVSKLATASMVFFSGGSPVYLSSVLWGTPFLEAMIQGMDRGLVFAGCSAGAMVAASLPSGRDPGQPLRWDRRWGVSRTSGLGLLPGVTVGVHWNQIPGWIPGLRSHLTKCVPVGSWFLGIENRTAVVGDGSEWTVMGERSAHLRRDNVLTTYRTEERFTTASEASLPLSN